MYFKQTKKDYGNQEFIFTFLFYHAKQNNVLFSLHFSFRLCWSCFPFWRGEERCALSKPVPPHPWQKLTTEECLLHGLSLGPSSLLCSGMWSALPETMWVACAVSGSLQTRPLLSLPNRLSSGWSKDAGKEHNALIQSAEPSELKENLLQAPTGHRRANCSKHCCMAQHRRCWLCLQSASFLER